MYNTSPPKILRAGSEREIPNGPLYPNILSSLESCTVVAVTNKCLCDLQLHNICSDDIRDLIKKAVKGNGYINSVWCSVNPVGRAIAACDAYEVDGYVKDSSGGLIPKKIYLKFCIAKTGKTIMQVSMHPSTFNN